MKEKFMWLIVGALLLVGIYHACGTQRRTAAAREIPAQPLRPERAGAYAGKAAETQWEELQKWRDRVSERVGRGDPLLPPDFDAFFGDEFFAGRADPFGELERIHLQTSEGLSGPGRDLFERNWEGWTGQRLRMESFVTTLETSADSVTLSVRVPGLTAGSAAADITAARIRLTFTAGLSSEVAGPAGPLAKETVRSYVKLLPLPSGADPATGRVETAGDYIKLRFARAR